MTDHASLLRQIRKDARPYVEQWLELSEVFSGFRKLASDNGLDWGVIKALIKAEAQDEKEGGTKKVERIIEKADFAAAYADMLGLGSKMNENNCSVEVIQGEVGREIVPPHDPSTGELIEEPDTRQSAEGMTALPEERGARIQQAEPNDGGSHEVAPETLRTFAKDTCDFSAGEGAEQSSLKASSHLIPQSDDLSIPAFLRRSKAA